MKRENKKNIEFEIKQNVKRHLSNYCRMYGNYNSLLKSYILDLNNVLLRYDTKNVKVHIITKSNNNYECSVIL